MERLGRLDDAALLRVADFMEAAPLALPPAPAAPAIIEATPVRRGWTRRQMLGSTLIGGAAVAATGGAVSALSHGQAAASADAALQAAATHAANEQAALKGLVLLYERLDGVGLDETVAGGLQAVSGALATVQQAAETVRGGVTRAEDAFKELDEALAILDNGLDVAERAVGRLAQAVQTLEDRLEAAGEPVKPLAEALGSFFTTIVGKIPFGVGERIVQTLDHVQAVVTSVPEAILGVNGYLIEPLRRRFFPREGGTLHVRVIDPLVSALFAPLDTLLGAVVALAEQWQRDLARPAERRMAERRELRATIADYRREQGLG